MSRHRDVRNMDYTEDYDGYDDVYGHSIDDDYYISPSNRQFLFTRENSRDQPKIGEFIRTEQDIQEEDESDMMSDLSDLDRARLESCIDQIKNTLGPLSISRNELINIIISHNYDVEEATKIICNNANHQHQSERKEKGVTNSAPKFFIPKLNGLDEKNRSPFMNSFKHPIKNFNIPSLSKFTSAENVSPKTFSIPIINSFSQGKSETCISETKKFDSLSDLVSNHLSKSLKNSLAVDSTDKNENISQHFDNLHITKAGLKETHSTSSEYQIDLSVALKSSSTLSSKSKQNVKEEENFEIPFMDCDVEVEPQTLLKSTFDIKDIVNFYLHNVKSVSTFGKVLCRRYRRRKIKINNRVDVKNIAGFNFATPSPDDSIIKHLKI